MKHNVMLTIASLLSILFFTFHLADDIVRGMEPGKLTNLSRGAHLCRLAVRNAGARRTAIGVHHHASSEGSFRWSSPRPHEGEGVGVTSSIGNSSGHFFFVWTLIAIGVTGLFSVILAARGLWSLQRCQSR